MISRIISFVSTLDGLWLLVSLIAGLGLFGYVGVTWLIYLIGKAHYLYATILSLLLILPALGALLRITLAQIIVLVSAAICGTTFLMGYGYTLMP